MYRLIRVFVRDISFFGLHNRVLGSVIPISFVYLDRCKKISKIDFVGAITYVIPEECETGGWYVGTNKSHSVTAEGDRIQLVNGRLVWGRGPRVKEDDHVLHGFYHSCVSSVDSNELTTIKRYEVGILTEGICDDVIINGGYVVVYSMTEMMIPVELGEIIIPPIYTIMTVPQIVLYSGLGATVWNGESIPYTRAIIVDKEDKVHVIDDGIELTNIYATGKHQREGSRITTINGKVLGTSCHVNIYCFDQVVNTAQFDLLRCETYTWFGNTAVKALVEVRAGTSMDKGYSFTPVIRDKLKCHSGNVYTPLMTGICAYVGKLEKE